MKARVYGFRLKSGSACTLGHLAEYFNAIGKVPFQFAKQDRMVFAGMKEGVCVGVLLSLKEQRKFPELDGETLTLHINDVEEGRHRFDFNFFAIDPKTGGGVYQHYRGACSLSTFGGICRRLYDDLVRNDCKGSQEALLNRSHQRISRKDQLDFSIAYRRDTFEEALKELQRVKSFEYDVFTQKDMSGELAPLKSFAKLERRTVRFKPDIRGKSIVERILDLIPLRSSNGAFRVTGNDDSGNPVTIDLDGNMPDEFHSEEVDTLADEMVLRLDNIAESTFVDTLLDVLKDNTALFGPEEDE